MLRAASYSCPGAQPSSPFPLTAEPTRQPTTKRRKRKNSTSSTSNSSAGNTTNSAGSKKKTPAASLSLSSQVPVSLTLLLGLEPCLFSSPNSGGWDSSLQLRKRKKRRRVLGSLAVGEGAWQGQGGTGQEVRILPW